MKLLRKICLRHCQLGWKIRFIDDGNMRGTPDRLDRKDVILIKWPRTIQKNDDKVRRRDFRASTEYTLLLDRIITDTNAGGIEQRDRNPSDIDNFLYDVAGCAGHRGNDSSLLG